jgi:hypothetical protein
LQGSKEEVIERLRETRRQIFETEYAHLYRSQSVCFWPHRDKSGFGEAP